MKNNYCFFHEDIKLRYIYEFGFESNYVYDKNNIDYDKINRFNVRFGCTICDKILRKTLT